MDLRLPVTYIPHNEGSETFLEASFVQDYPEWEPTRLVIDSNPNDMASWDRLIEMMEDLVAVNPSMSQEMKLLVKQNFEELLTRFPLFFGYWKKYVSVVYQLDGLDSSIDILSRSVTSFPNSLDLWMDYLSALVANRSSDKELIREKFEEAVYQCGRHFLSHPLWDKYLEWISSVEGESIHYMRVLLKVIRLPLHQYAKYFTKFYEIKPNFGKDDLLTEEESIKTATQLYSKSDGLSDEEIDHILDTFFLALFNNTQKLTTERWPFEAGIVTNFFNLELVPQEEVENWIKYLDFEEAQHNYLQTKALYERCLVPCALYESFWIKYLSFLRNSDSSEILNVFHRACNVFVPVDKLEVRFKYSRFAKSVVKNMDLAREILFTCCNLNTNSFEPFVKALELERSFLGNDEWEKQLVLFVGKQLDAEADPKRQKSDTTLSEGLLQLEQLVSPKTLGVVVAVLAKHHWINKKDVAKAREMFQQYCKEEQLKSCEPFWLWYFKLELSQRNKPEVVSVINYVKVQSYLPTTTINSMLKTYYEFMWRHSSVAETAKYRKEYIKIMLETDRETGFSQKTFAKMRVSENQDEETVNKRLARENGHPGLLGEPRPTITNKIDHLEPLFQDEKHFYPLPSFKNVEKAALPVRYPNPEKV